MAPSQMFRCPRILEFSRRVSWILPLALLAAACNKELPPAAAPSGDQPGYAVRYPTKLEALRLRFSEKESSARGALPPIRRIPDSFKNPSWATVKEVVERADREGRSAAYADAALESETVERFMDEERNPLRQKVAGGVKYAAQQKEPECLCGEDLGGAAAGSMERSIEKQLEERLRERSEAWRYIEDHEEEIGKANVDPLVKHAAKIAYTSYVVHVRLELQRRELGRLLDDASAVQSTLDREIKENDALLAQPDLTKNQKAGAERRKTAATQARARIENDVAEAKKAFESAEASITNLKKEYETAFDALVADLDARAQAQEAEKAQKTAAK